MQLMTIPKYKFKAMALEYLRMVQTKQEPILVTHNGIPVIKVSPYIAETPDPLKMLRNSLKKYVDPMEPVGVDDWEVLK